jgi:hypothetical protein
LRKRITTSPHPKARKNLLLAFLAVKFQCSNLKLQRRLSSFPYDALGNSPHGFRNNSFARQFVRTNFAGVKKKQNVEPFKYYDYENFKDDNGDDNVGNG